MASIKPLGDRVVVKRAGDVIPQVVRPVTEARTGNEERWTFPDTCPACGSEVVRLEEEADYYCLNTDCPAQFVRLVEHFVSRDAIFRGFSPAASPSVSSRRIGWAISSVMPLRFS